MHLDHLNKQNNNFNLMLGEFDKTSKSYLLHSIRYDHPLSAAAWMNEFRNGAAVKMDYPFKSAGYHVSLKSACNGLVYLGLNDGREFSLCLWNPATKEYKKLPESLSADLNDIQYSYWFEGCAVYGLCYDYETDDYKVVKVVNLTGSMYSFAYVYTLGSNSWKHTQNIPYKFVFCYRTVSGKNVSGDLGCPEASEWVEDVLNHLKKDGSQCKKEIKLVGDVSDGLRGFYK
ncbi:uncharacterized protein LOC113345706 [Papaver somniferum]|uniref:uncharacterized protein LOC113345706 n=1 Tax=Papaver somniferum TaxID=3469 RepID=UPI000E6FDF18|nr:uncharacterized protein LOC113345706 [Papaver somniferum]